MLTQIRKSAGLALVLLCAGAGFTGCARLGNRLEQGVLPEGAPPVETVLADLAANDGAIRNFREKQALLTLKSPKLKSTQVVSADIAFQQPDKLYIVGRQRAFRGIAFRIRSVGREYIVQVPSEDTVFTSRDDQPLEGVPFSVSPSDIARELFLPESWGELKPNQARMTGYDPATQTATLVIGPRSHPHRRIQVSGPPWRLVSSERLDEDGQVVARTVRSDYRDWEGIRFPVRIEATFPLQETELRLDKIDNPKFNSELEESLFVLDWNEYARAAH